MKKPSNSLLQLDQQDTKNFLRKSLDDSSFYQKNNHIDDDDRCSIHPNDPGALEIDPTHEKKPKNWSAYLPSTPNCSPKHLASSLCSFTTSYVPILKWLPKYKWSQTLKGDLIGALTIAMMILPQSVAYAQMAKLPPVYGLYSSFFPMMIYAIFGTSPHISVGPVALNSLLYATMVGQFYDPETQTADYIKGVATMTVYIGFIGIAFGILRLGLVIDYISPAVMTGFTTAYVIVTSVPQLPKIFGYKISKVEYPWQEVYEIGKGIEGLQWQPLVFGTATAIIIVLIQKWKPLYPGPLIAIVLTTATCLVLDKVGAENALPDIVGEVPHGLPSFEIPAITSPHFSSLFPGAAVLCLLGYMQSIAAAKKYAEMYNAQIDSNKELVALGLANVGGTLFGGFQSTGAFSRTAVGVASGARTQLTSFFTGSIVIICLCGITPAFYYIPQSALASVILVATFPLIDPSAHIRLWKVKPSDGFVALVTTVVTCATTVPFGLGAGVAASLLVPLVRTARPGAPLLGELPHPRTGVWKELKQYPEAVPPPRGIRCIRFDAEIFFTNIGYLRQAVLRAAEDMDPKHERNGPHCDRDLEQANMSHDYSKEKFESCVAESTVPAPCFIVLDLSATTDIDIAGAAGLADLAKDLLVEHNCTLLLGCVRDKVREILRKSWTTENPITIRLLRCFTSVSKAVEFAVQARNPEDKIKKSTCLESRLNDDEVVVEKRICESRQSSSDTIALADPVQDDDEISK